MKKATLIALALGGAAFVQVNLIAPAFAGAARIVVTNDDSSSANTTTLYRVKDKQLVPSLKLKTTIATGGVGDGDGYLEGQQQAFVRSGGDSCLFISDAGSPDIAAINASTGLLVGNFRGSMNDDANPFGISLLPSPDRKVLYAAYRPRAFGQGSPIAVFQIGAGCSLSFVSDVQTFGSQGGGLEGMAAHGNILVVGFGDGSIQSFRIKGSSLKTNHDQQNSTGFVTHNTGLGPGSVQITNDGHFAVFGDLVSNNQGQFTEIEVSDISSGKLTPTVDYGGAHHSNGDLGAGISSNSAVLSSDENHIYVSNVLSGQVTVLAFDPATGVVSPGCISSPLSGFGAGFAATGQIAAAGVENGKDVVWVSEDGNGAPSGIGIVEVAFDGATCTVSESPGSPASDPNSTNLRSLTAF
jgi:hypothetical protein